VPIEINERAERKAGQFLREMKEQDLISKGGASTHLNSTADTMSAVKTLAEMGVEQQESSRWQRIEAIPDEEFEDRITNAKKITQNMSLV